MRALLILLLTLGLCVTSSAAGAVTGRVFKVLPLLLDQQGRAALSPSLYDRDAYQAELRQHTNMVSAIRYDVLWSAKNAGDKKLKLRLELRGTGTANEPKLKTLEAEVTPGFFHKWTELPLSGEEYKSFGGVTAWRASLWDGDKLIGDQKSFLW
ncbi:MAG TPA: hypothetical protein VGI63_09655 [Verrucomicrobiae bacterium]|jgi:hypothetical protein